MVTRKKTPVEVSEDALQKWVVACVESLEGTLPQCPRYGVPAADDSAYIDRAVRTAGERFYLTVALYPRLTNDVLRNLENIIKETSFENPKAWLGVTEFVVRFASHPHLNLLAKRFDEDFLKARQAESQTFATDCLKLLQKMPCDANGGMLLADLVTRLKAQAGAVGSPVSPHAATRAATAPSALRAAGPR